MPLTDLVQDSGFRTGLTAGAVALLIVVVLALGRGRAARRRTGPRRPGRRRRAPMPVAGIAVVGASLIGLWGGDGPVDVSDRVVAGLILLAVGSYVASFRRSWLIATAAMIPGAALITWAVELEKHASFVPPLVFAATALGGALVADFDRANARAGLGPVLLAFAALAAYATLPDTEEIAAVVGAALPIALLGVPLPVASLGGPGAASAVGLFVWVAAVDGRGRPGSVVGAIACLGVMLVEPLARRALPERWRSSPKAPISPHAVFVVALDLGLVAVTARVAGLRTSASAAAAVAVPALVAATAVLVVFSAVAARRARNQTLAGSRSPPVSEEPARRRSG